MKLFSMPGSRRAAAKLEALQKSRAVIEFGMDGRILTANANFLDALGYTLAEVAGGHHSMFVEAAEKASTAYEAFWASLRRGEFQSAEYKRLGKGGREVWIQATYNPVLERRGRPVQIVKYATDVTAQKLRTADMAGQVAAVGKSQAVIQFSMDGNILDANANFLAAVGYSLAEVRGQHHGMFVDPTERAGAAYREFWSRLNRGEFQAAEYKRFGKGKRELWLQATYNPIFDPSGKPFKIIKYATDVTGQKLHGADMTGQIAAIGKSQAVIHFAMDGTILDANENFQLAMGYSLPEIKGNRHSMFVEPERAASADYRAFWDGLRRGEFQAAEYKRVGKGGREVWIQATYNPILDLNGQPFKVVKYATDITARIRAQQGGVASAEVASANVNAVAAAVEEITASVSEISNNMNQSATLVEAVHARASEANHKTLALNEAARSMSSVTQLIQGIASQISLLSLNATIEAARAGETGRGFAVVAGEVKSLANQTTTATSQISREIEAMQAASNDVAATLQEIVGSIGTVREFVSSVASAVVEQRAVTCSISENMQTAAAEVSEIRGHLGNMTSATRREA